MATITVPTEMYHRTPLKVDILGSEWDICFDQIKMPEGTAGICREEARMIRIARPDNIAPDSPYPEACVRRVLRHELTHAMLAECGLGVESDWTEEQVDWVARQFPKLKELFSKTECDK